MQTFQADRQVSGYVSCGLLALVLLGVNAAVVAVVAPGTVTTFDVVSLLLLLMLTLPNAVVALVVLGALPRMRYELWDAELVLCLGPWRSKVPYADIVSAVRRDLVFGPLSSFRMPGVAVFNVSYSDEGVVRMYSTHALKDVILITTANGHKYGISPADPEGFLAALAAVRSGPAGLQMAGEPARTGPAPARAVNFPRWPLPAGLVVAVSLTVLSLVLLPRLPPTVVTHWGLDGTPNGMMPRLPGVMAMPLVAFLLALLPLALPRASRASLALATFPVQAVLAVAQLFLLLWNLGPGQGMAHAFVPFILVLSACSVVFVLVVALRVQKPRDRSAS